VRIYLKFWRQKMISSLSLADINFGSVDGVFNKAQEIIGP
jgi:hypothetical protein